MHVITTLRTYLGMTQTELAKEAGVTQCDVSEMENQAPYGKIHKYLRLGQYLGVPMEALIKNDFTAIPESFFDGRTAPDYTLAPQTADRLLGRQGEEFIFAREQARLRETYPALARLVLPHFKLKGASPGYDILTFDNTGHPFYLEVKTSILDTGGFRLTNHELGTAIRKTRAGERYDICYISKWGQEDQEVEDLHFSELENTHNIKPQFYFCTPRPEKRTVTGMAYHRHRRGYRQEEVARTLEIGKKDLSFYENGLCLPPVTVCIKASQLLDVPIDALLEEHEDPFSFEEVS